MKFALERDALLRALDHAQRIVLRKEPSPILNTVLVTATAHGVRLCASNLDLMAETGCPADVEVTGEACIAFEPLYKLLQRLPAGAPLAVSGNASLDRVEFRCRRSVVELPVLPPADFPRLSMLGSAAEAEIDGAALARLLGTPAHIADPDSCYAFGVGVHLCRSADGETLCGIATNGLRVTRVLLPAGETADDLPPIILAIKPVGEIVKLAKAANGPVRLRVTEYALSAYAADVTITTKLVEARFPDVSRFFPASYEGSVRVTAGEFDAALNRTLILADDQDRNVHCAVADGSLSIRTRNYDPTAIKGTVAEEIDAEGGEGLNFSANAKMIREAIDAVGADVIEIRQMGAGQPIALRAVGDDAVVGLVMPTLG